MLPGIRLIVHPLNLTQTRFFRVNTFIASNSVVSDGKWTHKYTRSMLGGPLHEITWVKSLCNLYNAREVSN